MKRRASIVVAMSLAVPMLSHAHPGNHAGGEFAAWLRHMLLSPDHLPALILAGLVIVLGVVLVGRRVVRREKGKRRTR